MSTRHDTPLILAVGVACGLAGYILREKTSPSAEKKKKNESGDDARLRQAEIRDEGTFAAALCPCIFRFGSLVEHRNKTT